MSENNQKILIAEDDQGMRINLFEALTQQGFDVSVAENGSMALDKLQSSSFDLLISDIKMPEIDGLELLQKVRVTQPGLPAIIITGFATVNSAVEAMKRGAADYILKPFPMEVILETVKRVLAQSLQDNQLSGSQEGIDSAGYFQIVKGNSAGKNEKEIVGQEASWLKIEEKAKAVASSTATVLILGESGTGKEVVARYIHNQSDRKTGPFVALNCAALPDGLLESELFGHEKGAFTGAVSSKKGKFELANGGTLLLDEIGEVPLHLQAKLLRVLQEEEVDRLGGKGPVKFNVHVLATTNRNLSEAVENGDFRQDLFYRLNVIPLRLPSLKERKGDICLLADYFIKRYTRRYKKESKKMSANSTERFLAYAWPGNVREMENMIERAVLLSKGVELEPWDLWDENDTDYLPPDEATQKKYAAQLGLEHPNRVASKSPIDFVDDQGQMSSLREVERQMIMQALHKTDNNRTHAAKMLGISVRTLRNKLHEYRNKGLIK